MQRSIRKLSAQGDTEVVIWDPETVTPEVLEEIERQYNALVAEGFTGVDITDKRDEITNTFDPNADALMIPRMQGGSR